jgi:hypothetical protein
MGSHHSRTVDMNLVNQQLISSSQTFSQNCFSSVEGSQNVSITGNADYNRRFTDEVTSATASNCLLCQNAMNELQKRRAYVENVAISMDSSYVASKLEDPSFGGIDYADDKKEGKVVLDNPCDLVCKTIVVDSISQKLQITANTNCTVDNDVTNNVTQSLSAKIQQQLKNQQDIFGQFLDSFSSSSMNVNTNIQTTISANVDQRFVNDLITSTNATQTVEVDPGSASVFISALSQDFQATSNSNLDAVNHIYNEIKSSAAYSIAQSLLNKQDTVGDLTKNLNNALSTVANLIDNIVTYVIICVACFILGIFLVMALMSLFSKRYQQKVLSAFHLGGEKTTLNVQPERAQPMPPRNFVQPSAPPINTSYQPPITAPPAPTVKRIPVYQPAV